MPYWQFLLVKNRLGSTFGDVSIVVFRVLKPKKKLMEINKRSDMETSDCEIDLGKLINGKF